MKRKQSYLEAVVHGIFLLLGLVTVACVLLITVYLVVSGIPAIREIGIVKFLFGTEWASTAAEPKYGILPFILTSVYGTAGAILLGVPVGFFTAVYLAKKAPKSVKEIVEYIVHNGLMKDMSVLQDAPFTDNGSVVEVFTDLTVWRGIKRVIDRINANAIAA